MRLFFLLTMFLWYLCCVQGEKNTHYLPYTVEKGMEGGGGQRAWAPDAHGQEFRGTSTNVLFAYHASPKYH